MVSATHSAKIPFEYFSVGIKLTALTILFLSEPIIFNFNNTRIIHNGTTQTESIRKSLET